MHPVSVFGVVKKRTSQAVPPPPAASKLSNCSDVPMICAIKAIALTNSMGYVSQCI